MTRFLLDFAVDSSIFREKGEVFIADTRRFRSTLWMPCTSLHVAERLDKATSLSAFGSLGSSLASSTSFGATESGREFSATKVHINASW